MVSHLKKLSHVASGTNILKFYYGKFKTSIKLDRIKYESAYLALGPNLTCHLFLWFYWSATTFIHLHVVYGCLPAMMAELQQRPYGPKALNIYYWALFKKCTGP